MLMLDERSGSNELFKYLPDAYPCYLDSGDVAIPGNGPAGDILVGVEVKKIADLLQSESTGRLSGGQLPKFVVDYQEVWLLLVGEFRSNHRGHLEVLGSGGNKWRTYRIGSREVPISYIDSYLIELAAVGVAHKQVKNNFEAARWLLNLEWWWSKPWAEHKAMKKFDNSGARCMVQGDPRDPVFKAKLQTAETANSLPGIGWERAWALAERFTCPEDLINARVEELVQVPGIGKVMAQAMRRAISGK